jgi:hypothetical protein
MKKPKPKTVTLYEIYSKHTDPYTGEAFYIKTITAKNGKSFCHYLTERLFSKQKPQ